MTCTGAEVPARKAHSCSGSLLRNTSENPEVPACHSAQVTPTMLSIGSFHGIQTSIQTQGHGISYVHTIV